MRARGGAGVSVGQGVGDAGDARPRAGSVRPRRVGRVLAPGARREPASRASRGAREKRFKRRARGGFPPARCFVGSRRARRREKATTPDPPFDASRLDPGASARSRGRIPRDRARDRAPRVGVPRDGPERTRRARRAAESSRGKRAPGGSRGCGEGSTEKRPARARARLAPRVALRLARRVSDHRARVVVSPRRALTGRCAFVVRLERADESGARARGCRSLGAGKRFRSGHAKPRFPARGGHKSAVSVREISGESKSPIARPHVESRRMGPIATCPSRVKDPD